MAQGYQDYLRELKDLAESALALTMSGSDCGSPVVKALEKKLRDSLIDSPYSKEDTEALWRPIIQEMHHKKEYPPAGKEWRKAAYTAYAMIVGASGGVDSGSVQSFAPDIYSGIILACRKLLGEHVEVSSPSREVLLIPNKGPRLRVVSSR